MKKSDFKKKYVSIKQGRSVGQGTRSGRAIGIPVGGAIGGGDDYKQKIGRNKIPWTRTGFKGSPSQSADSGFSSYLARVNRGYEDEAGDFTMFPDQEDASEEIDDDNTALISDKLPKYTGGKSPVSEDTTMSNLRSFVSETVKEEIFTTQSEEQEDKSELNGVVDIKADDGNIVTQPREALQELRDYIRECLSEKISESKKAILKSDDDDGKSKKKKKKTKEASTVANISGYTAPMSAPANAKNFYSNMEKAYHGKIIGDIPKPTP
tara:strand:+ start:91 stop:888 length:798 start_codon:yes stop_codon:yes gene_type:complete